MAKRKSIFEQLGDLFDGDDDQQTVPPGDAPEPVTKRVTMIIHNPRVPSEDNSKLNQVLGWNEPRKLAEGYIADMKAISHGYVNYKIVEEREVARFPVKADGFTYEADEFVKAYRARKGFHDPDAVSYDALLDEFEMVDHINRDKTDEFWLFAFPYAGYYESIMGGPGAFWCNAPPLKQTDRTADRRFVIMGFNYERGVGEMLENFGHRTESILREVYRKKQGDENLWERFIRHEKNNPGRAEVGWMHYAPNSERDYDWGNERKVSSRWKTWRTFPDLSGEAEMCNCSDWGDGDIRLHHQWWFKLLPHVSGKTQGISNNWWQYTVDPDLVP